MLDTEVKTRILNEVDKRFDDQTKVLPDLVKIPSTRFPFLIGVTRVLLNKLVAGKRFVLFLQFPCESG